MDPLSISASIGALLTIAVKLMSAGYSYGSSVKDFPQELQDLMAELQSLSAILTTLSVIYGQAPPGTVVNSQSAIDPFGGALAGCERCLRGAFEELEKHNSGNRLRKIFKRITWPLTESETKELFNRLERYKSTFSLAISSYDTTLRRATFDGIEELKNHEVQKSAKKESARKDKRLREIIRWLSSADPEVNHMAAREIRQDGTCKWFTEGKLYQDWLSADSSFLWLHAGAGKTILSSIVIDRVVSDISTNVYPNGAPVIIYFYCDFKDSSKQTVDSLVGSLIAQLIRGQSEVPTCLEKLYRDQFDDGLKPPNAVHLEECLASIIKQLPKVIVIIDALDECTTEKRDRLCKRLKNLIGQGNINILVISRYEPDIREEFSGLPAILIKDEDVSLDIELYVTAELSRQARLRRLKPSTKSSIVTTLVNEANGMFRWASCCLDEIAKLRTDKAIRAALTSLPPTLEQSYERILCNIDERDKILVVRVFQWLLFSYRPMDLWEITDAIAVELGDTSMDPEAKLNEPEDIVNICGGLVKVDHRNMTLGLAHFTVKEYLLSTKITRGPAAYYQICLPVANAELTKTCLTYILFDDFITGACKDPDELNARFQEYPLLRYAGTNWLEHIAKYQIGSDDTLDELFLNFSHLDSNHGKFLSWLQVYLSQRRKDHIYFTDGRGKSRQWISTPLHIAVALGNPRVVKELLESGGDIDVICDESREWPGTPLSLAVRENKPDIARILLEKGADPNKCGDHPLPPLVYAARMGSVECVQVLLSYGAEAPDDDGRYAKAIDGALAYGHDAVAGLLLSTDESKDLISAASCEDPNIHNHVQFYLALQASASRGLEAIFRKFWDTDWGADMLIKRDLLTPFLELAIANGHIKFIKIIMQNDKAKEHCLGEESFCVMLREAAYAGNEDIFDLLLTLKEKIPASSMEVALNSAASQGHTHIIESLLQEGADPFYKDAQGWSPLLYTSEYDRVAATKFLSAIENISESVKLAGTTAPTAWQTTHPRPGIDLSADGLEVKSVGTEPRMTVEADSSIPPLYLQKKYSFEVDILEICETPNPYISIGFADAMFFRQSLWQAQRPEERTIFEEHAPCITHDCDPSMFWGFSNGGSIGYGESFRHVKGYGAHDIVGCHFDGTENVAFFTVNGEIAGKPIAFVRGKLVPTITLGPGVHIRANFGNGSQPLTYAAPQLSEEILEESWVLRKDLLPGILSNFPPLV